MDKSKDLATFHAERQRRNEYREAHGHLDKLLVNLSRDAIARSRTLLERTDHMLGEPGPQPTRHERPPVPWHDAGMTSPHGKPRGIAGYGGNAELLAPRYESVSFEDVHGDVLDLLPQPPARALDIGAGTGRDAAALAGRGYRVTAVEPTPEFRAIGQSLHENATIEWLDDALPELSNLHGSFDLILLSAVWMHLGVEERAQAMARVSGFLQDGGVMVLSLRHGPIPEGRIMFEVTPEETIALAEMHGLHKLYRGERAGRLDQPDVWWDRLVFRRAT